MNKIISGYEIYFHALIELIDTYRPRALYIFIALVIRISHCYMPANWRENQLNYRKAVCKAGDLLNIDSISQNMQCH